MERMQQVVERARAAFKSGLEGASQKKVDWAKFLLLKWFNKGRIGLAILALLWIVATMVAKAAPALKREK